MPFGSNVVGFSILDFLPFLFFVSPILYLVVGSSRIPVLDGHCTFVLTHFTEIYVSARLLSCVRVVKVVPSDGFMTLGFV